MNVFHLFSIFLLFAIILYPFVSWRKIMETKEFQKSEKLVPKALKF